MNTLLSPKTKLLASLALLGTLPVIALLQGMQASAAARLTLGLTAVGGLVWWFSKNRNATTAFAMPKRLEVIQRVGLSQRSALALVEVDGQPYLVIHGEGFAKVQRTMKRGPKLVKGATP